MDDSTKGVLILSILLVVFIILFVITYIYYYIIPFQTNYGQISIIQKRNHINETTHPGISYQNKDSQNSIASINTRGDPSNFTQIGYLTSGDKTIPLFGRKLYTSSSNWNYFTRTDSFHTISIPISYKNKICDDEVGCQELYDGDSITIPEINNTDFTVKLYRTSQYRYSPLPGY